MIDKISDIQLGKEYFVLLAKNKNLANRAIVKDIVNEKIKFNSDQTEVVIDILAPKRMMGTKLLYFNEIGIGETKDEALNNYGRFTYEENSSFSSHYDM